MIIENDETKNKYWVDDDEKYINFDRYEENNKNKNKYKKNQEDEKDESNDDANDDEDIIMIKIIKLFN